MNKTERIYINSIVRENLMLNKDYTPYCGDDNCAEKTPRTNWNTDKEQFTCKCGWVSNFPKDFIESYIKQWGLRKDFLAFKKDLKALLEKYDAEITFEIDENSDTHGIFGEHFSVSFFDYHRNIQTHKLTEHSFNFTISKSDL